MAEKLYYREDIFLLRIGNDQFAIQEPAKWDQVLIEVLWDEKLGGYRFEFSDAEVLLEFDRASGYDILRQQYKMHRTNADVLLIFGSKNGSVVTVDYEAKLNFDSYDEDKVKVKLNCERKSFSDKFINYYDTKVNINDTVSLGGLNLDPLTKKPLYLHPRLLTQTANMVYDPTFDVSIELHDEPLGPGGQQVVQTAVPPFVFRKVQPSLDCSEESSPTGANIEGITEPLTPDGMFIDLGTFPDGVTKRSLKIRCQVSFKFDMGNSSGQIYAGLYIHKYSVSADTALIPLFDSDDNSWLVDFREYGNVASVNNNQTYLVDGVIDVTDADAGISIKCFVRGASTDPPALDGDSSLVTITNFAFTNTNNHKLTINEQTVYPPSLTQAHRPFELANRQLELILDSINPLRSTLLGRMDLDYDVDGCASNDLMLDGLLLRGFLCKPLNLSAKQWIEGLNGLWNTGVSMERDNDGNEFVRYELLEYFFRDVQLASFEDGVSEYHKGPDLQVTFNEVSSGFKKYPDGKRDNQPDSLEDWMTVMNYITPNTKYKNKFENMVEFILSSYYIEYTRRENFKEKPTDSYETDQDIFVIVSKLISELIEVDVEWDEDANTITIKTIAPLVPGDIFTIQNSDPDLNFTYQVKSIEIPFSYDRVIITPTVELLSLSTGSGTGTADIIFDERYQAKRDEEYSDVDGVPFPKSAYNLDHHIMRIVRRWAKFFSSGFSQYYPDQKIKFVSGINNIGVATQLSEEAECGVNDDKLYDRGPGGAAWDAPLFSGDLIHATVPMDFSLMNNIRKAFEGRHPDDLNYGYLSVKNPEGVMEHGWARRITFSPKTNSCKLVLREKYTQP